MEHLLKFSAAAARRLSHGLRFLLLLAAVFGMSSCVMGDGSEGEPVGDSQNSILFSSGKTVSRATVTTSLKKFGAFGYSHAGTYASASATSRPDYFLNTPTTDPIGSGDWTYAGVVRYWPMTGINLSFFAYAPYDDVGQHFTLTPTSLGDTPAPPKIAYTVPSAIDDQIDLMWSNVLNQTHASNGGKVDFKMGHALTRLGFQIKLRETSGGKPGEEGRPFVVEFTELTVRNVVGSGVLDLSKASTDADLWTLPVPTTDADLTTYTLTPGAGLQSLSFDARNTPAAAGTVDPFAYNDLLETGQYLMLIPQAVNDLGIPGLTQAQMVLKFTYTNVYSGESVDSELTFNLSQGSLVKWTAGQALTYQLVLSLVEGAVIEFDIEGMIVPTPWNDVNSNDPIQGGVN